jgi:hypothetical protein
MSDNNGLIKNVLIVTGDSEDVGRFAKRPFQANEYVPEPEQFANAHLRRDWRIKHWSEERDWDQPIVESVGLYLRLSFETHWTPPLAVLELASRAHKDIFLTVCYTCALSTNRRGEIVFKAGRRVRELWEERQDWEDWSE